VVLAGVTVAEPDTGSAVALTLGVMLTEVALVLLQVKTTDCPSVIWFVAAVMLAVGVDGSGGGGVFLLPPQAARVSASSVVVRAARARPRWSFLYMAEVPRGMLILANRN
jgi:hypothetical protein